MAAFAVKKYSGHRGVSTAVEAVLNKQADVAAVPVPVDEIDDSEADSSDEAIA
jgi:hypothetical protein